jgi:glycosyltransferase involved in cell wall biosynthesis
MNTKMCEPAISIVIPTYNGEKYLAKTISSILDQTFTSYEIICIDDCSTDASLSLLKDFERKDERIRVFSMPSNLGIVPKVINFAIPYIRGAYYVYSSQDDLFSIDWLEKMHDRAQETNADAVIPDLVFYHEDESRNNRELIGVNGNRDICISNREAVLLSLDWSIPANALWNSSIIKQIGYYDFGMNADEYSSRVHFFHCNKIAFSKGIFYYRQDNPDAITKRLSSKSFDLPYTDFKLWEFLKANDFPIRDQVRSMKRSVLGLLKWKFDLIRHNGEPLDGADERLEKTFTRLKQHGIRKVLCNELTFKYAIALIGFMGNYRFFSNVMICATHLRNTKHYITIQLGTLRKKSAIH